MTDPRREATPTSDEELAALAEVHATDNARADQDARAHGPPLFLRLLAAIHDPRHGPPAPPI